MSSYFINEHWYFWYFQKTFVDLIVCNIILINSYVSFHINFLLIQRHSQRLISNIKSLIPYRIISKSPFISASFEYRDYRDNLLIFDVLQKLPCHTKKGRKMKAKNRAKTKSASYLRRLGFSFLFIIIHIRGTKTLNTISPCFSCIRKDEGIVLNCLSKFPCSKRRESV